VQKCDRIMVTNFELKTNPFAQAKDVIIKKGSKVERVKAAVTLPWQIEQAHIALTSVLASRRFGRLSIVTAKLFPMKQPSRSLPYKQFVLQSAVGSETAVGRFYGYFADIADEIAEGTEVTLVQPKVELEGPVGNETLVVILDDTMDPPCAIGTA
jgi:hypothetical protein